jgi:hypothetical protein
MVFIVYPSRWKVGLKFVIRRGMEGQIAVAEMWLKRAKQDLLK